MPPRIHAAAGYLKMIRIALVSLMAIAGGLLLASVAVAADFPLEELPSHISLVVPSGERADWEPGGSDRFIYVTEPGGSPRERTLSKGIDREITAPGLAGGCWRIYYLSDENYLMTIGGDRGSATLHVIDKSGTVPSTDLGEIAHEGVAVSRNGLRVAWTTGHEIHLATIAYDADGVAYLTDKETILNSAALPSGDGTIYNGDIEPQNFRPPLEDEIIFARYGTSSTNKYSSETWGYNLSTGETINYSNRHAWYDEPEGVFPDGQYTLVETDIFLPESDHARVIDLYRMGLDGTGEDMLRLTHFGDVEHSPGVNFKANQGVISVDGKYMLFGEGRANTQDQPGSGFGIYLFDFAEAGIEVGSPPALGEAGAGGDSDAGGLAGARSNGRHGGR